MKTKIFTQSAILLSTAFSLGAFAGDYSVGSKNADGSETPVLSIHTDGTTRKIRFVPSPTEIKCSRFRQDFCNHTQDVTMVEISVPANSCAIESPLASCDYDSFAATSTVADLKDGSTINLQQITGRITVSNITDLEMKANNAFVTVTSLNLNLQIWGDRADGLDPLVQSVRPSMFLVKHSQIVGKSLFD